MTTDYQTRKTEYASHFLHFPNFPTGNRREAPQPIVPSEVRFARHRKFPSQKLENGNGLSVPVAAVMGTSDRRSCTSAAPNCTCLAPTCPLPTKHLQLAEPPFGGAKKIRKGA